MSGAKVARVEDLQNARMQFRRLVDHVRPALEEVVARAAEDAGHDAVAHEFIDRINGQRRRFEDFAEAVDSIIAQLDKDITKIENLKSTRPS